MPFDKAGNQQRFTIELVRSIPTNHTFGLETGLVFFAVDGLDLAIMSVHSRFASRFVSWTQNFGSVFLLGRMFNRTLHPSTQMDRPRYKSVTRCRLDS